MPCHDAMLRSQRSWATLLPAVGATMLWVVGRLLMLHVFIRPESNYITSDVKYYLRWIASGNPDTLIFPEYPLPVVWFMRILYWAGGDGYFTAAFSITMLLLDVIFVVVLWCEGHRWGALWWIVLVPLLGPLMWNRFDMVPAVCMGLAALWYRRHPAACGVMIALGAATKLWPALLIFPMISRHKTAIRRLIAFTITGCGLTLASLLAGGWNRLISPLTWQSDRGLQIESVPATVLILRRSHSIPGPYTVEPSKYNAYEIFGPGVASWQSFSTILMALAVILAVGLGAVAWRRNGLDHQVVVLADLVIIAALIVANKTLSPQYLIWWAAPAAVILDRASTENADDVLNRPDQRDRTRMWCWIIAALMSATAAATQLEYPLRYGRIIQGGLNSTLLLVGRNALVVVTFLVCLLTLVMSLRERDGRSDNQPLSPRPE